MTFIVLAILIYEEAWLVQREMWICATCIPLIAYIMGFLVAWAAKFTMGILVSKYKVNFIEPEALIEFDWSECRTIGLACGLQNTQLGMSTVFGAYSMDDQVISDMHSYSPLYGVIELIYAFILAAAYLLLERYYYRISSSAGPRIPNINIEQSQHYLDEYMKDENDEVHFTPDAIRDLLRRLPRGLVKRMGVDNINYEDMDEDQTYATLQTITSYCDTMHDNTSPEDQRAMDDLLTWNTLRRQKEEAEPGGVELRHRNVTQIQESDLTRQASQIADFSTGERPERIPSHVADFSVQHEQQKPSRFSVKRVIKPAVQIEDGTGSETGSDQNQDLSNAVEKRGKFTITSQSIPMSEDDLDRTLNRSGSVSSDFEIFAPNQKSRFETVSVQSAPDANHNQDSSRPPLKTQISLPDQFVKPENKSETKKGRFAIRTQSKPKRRGKSKLRGPERMFNFLFLESGDSLDDVFEETPPTIVPLEEPPSAIVTVAETPSTFVTVNLSVSDDTIDLVQPNESEA